MKKTLTILFIILMLISCTKDKKHTMLVQGEIKNLKKGTLFLQKVKDTLMVTVDSILLDGVNTFTLSDQVESPEMYFLSLDKLPSKQLSFFGEAGTITIDTKLDKFLLGATIQGLTNQTLLEEYLAMKDQFADKRLDLIKADFEAKKSGDSILIDSIEKQINSLIKRRYYYTTNFAVSHPDKEVAPYLALTELFDVNLSLLDTIHNSLSDKVREGTYGKALTKYLSEIKEKP